MLKGGRIGPLELWESLEASTSLGMGSWVVTSIVNVVEKRNEGATVFGAGESFIQEQRERCSEHSTERRRADGGDRGGGEGERRGLKTEEAERKLSPAFPVEIPTHSRFRKATRSWRLTLGV